MVARNWTLLCGVVLLSFLDEVFGNGRLLVPPQRSSLWRDPVFQRNRRVFKNYDDHTLNCGGFWKMHENNGKCGVCGDAWDDEKPRANEAGGMYARGVIGRTYSTDKRFIDTLVQITSSISGYFEFNICPNDDVKTTVSRVCLEQFPLRILSKDRSISYGRRYFPEITAGLAGVVELSLEIPEGLECTQCVLQWRWHGANNYGLCRNGRWGKGCGEQSEIYNCADIAILSENGSGKKDDKYNDKSNKLPAATTTTQKTTTTGARLDVQTTTLKDIPSTISITSTTQTLEKDTTAHTDLLTTPIVVPKATTSDNPSPKPNPGPEPEPKEEQSTQSTRVQTTTYQTETISTSANIFRQTSTPVDINVPETSTSATTNNTITEATKSSPGPSTGKMEHSTVTSFKTTEATQISTTTSLNGNISVTEEQTRIQPIQTSTGSLTDQTSTRSSVDITSNQTTTIPAVTTIRMNLSTEGMENTTTELTTKSITSTEMEKSTTTPGGQTTSTFTESLNSQTTQPTQNSTSSPAVGTTDTVEVQYKSTTELKTTTDSTHITDSAVTQGAGITRISTTVGIENTSTEQLTTKLTTSASPDMNKSTTADLYSSTDKYVDTTTMQTLTSGKTESNLKSTRFVSTAEQVSGNTRVSTDGIKNPSTEQVTTEMTTSSAPAMSKSATAEFTPSAVERVDTTTTQTLTSGKTESNIRSTSFVSTAEQVSGNTRVSTDGIKNPSTEQVTTEMTTSSAPAMSKSTTAEFTPSAVERVDTTTTQTLTSGKIESNIRSTSFVSTAEQVVVTTESAVNKTSQNDNPVRETSSITVPTSSEGASNMPTNSSTIVSESSTKPNSPLVKGNIITNTDVPTASEPEISLVNLLNELSKMDNVTSGELINALSIPVNDNSSNINVNESTPLTAINITSSTKNVTTGATTTLQSTNDNNTSQTTTTTTLRPGIDSKSTTETTLFTDATTDYQVNAGVHANVVTARTTRIVQPRGGRFGGGISVGKLTPVDQIVNIDLNIPGGDAHSEKDSSKGL